MEEKINKITKWVGLFIFGWIVGLILDYLSLTYLYMIWLIIFPIIVFSIALHLLNKEKIEDIKIILIILIIEEIAPLIARLLNLNT